MYSDLSDEDVPLASSQPNGHHVNGVNGKHGPNGTAAEPDSDEDMPLSQSVAASSPAIVPARKRKKALVDSSSEEEVPLASSPPKQAAIPMPGAVGATTVPASVVNGNGKPQVKKEATPPEPDSDDTGKKPPRNRRPPKKKVKLESDDDSESNAEETPKAKKKAAPRKRKSNRDLDADFSEDEKPKKAKGLPKSKKVKKEEGDDNSETKPRAKKAKEVNGSVKKGKLKKEEVAKSPKKGKGKKDDEEGDEEDDVHRWWEITAEGGDNSVKWTTLEHSGVLFPPPYELLPKDVKMKYNGQPVDLPPEAEEVAGFYAVKLETDHANDDTFNKNFFNDWKTVLKKHPPRDGTKITNFVSCDFRPIFEYYESEKAKKKAMTTAEKKEAKKLKDEAEAKYVYCLLDGRKEKIGNFRIEPPGIFMGRGEHPKKGCLKHRLRPEDITLNIGKGVAIPEPNISGKWGHIQHDNTVTWLANWTENVNGNHKYVFLAAGSSLKGQSDMNKFEKARELKNHVDRIRLNYQQDLKSKVMADRQRATAMYFIDKLALRAGNEKGEDEADTVGCCSLRCEHVTLRAPDHLIFDFLGKDSIRYFNEVKVEPQIFKNIRIFKDNKDDSDNLFDRVSTSGLNSHLAKEMKGLTAKVFRTYNASQTLQNLLDKEDFEGKTLQEKLNVYNKANREVAILCNHQRSAPKTHDQSMGKMRQKLRGIKYDRMKLRHALFDCDPKYKKNKKYEKYQDDESDIDEEFIEVHEDEMKKLNIEKAEKKFAKENEKLESEGQKPQNPKVLKERKQAIEDEFKRLVKERGTQKAAQKGKEKTAEKLMEGIDKIDDKIKTFKLQMEGREDLKQVALTTSKINYLDPRITAAWCKTYDVPIEKIFSKALLVKFPWAMEVEPDWKF